MNKNMPPILNGLSKYKDENILRFHMPGHYGKSNFAELDYLCENILNFDVTEVEGTDNLNDPQEMILESLEYISQLYKSKKSYILLNGSTSGIHVAIDTLVENGAHVITARNCHKSIHNILEHKNVNIHYVYPKIDSDFCVDSHIEYEDLVKAVTSAKNKAIDIQAVILTYPNYFGRTYNLKKISDFLKSENIFLIVDEAHGAHFTFNENLPKTSIELGATVSVQSAHKTLPAFTQTAMLHLGNDFPQSKLELLESKIQFFQTTSPSYILMASCETAVYIMDKYGVENLNKIKQYVENMKNKLSECPYIKIYESKNNDLLQDFCKFGINTPIPGEKLSHILRKKYKIQAEMAIGFNVLFMIGITHTEKDLERLENSILDIIKNNENLFEPNFKLNLNNLFPKAESVTSSKLYKNKKIDKNNIIVKKIKDIDNDICAEKIIPYPPGIPLILPYEIINNDIKIALEYHKFSEIKCFDIS